MNPHTPFASSPWSTSAFGSEIDLENGPAHGRALPGRQELAARAALGEHLGACLRLRGPLFALRCAAEALCGFVAARQVTSLLALLLLSSALTLSLA